MNFTIILTVSFWYVHKLSCFFFILVLNTSLKCFNCYYFLFRLTSLRSGFDRMKRNAGAATKNIICVFFYLLRGIAESRNNSRDSLMRCCLRKLICEVLVPPQTQTLAVIRF